MRTALRAAVVLAVLGLSMRAAQGMEPGLDYFADPGGAIDALARGDLPGFFGSQPLMGSFSLILRAPFVSLVFHESEATVYLAGAIPCLLATLVLGAVLGRLVADRGQPAAVQGAVMGLAVINPVTFRALHWGHPEELLAAAFCVGAVIAATRERDILAGVLLGLALATKQWALIAVLPALLAAPERRLRLGGTAAVVACALTLPMAVANPGQFIAVLQGATGGRPESTFTTPWNLLWPFAQVMDSPAGRTVFVSPEWIARLSHPLIVVIGIPAAYLLWRRRDRRADDALLLLTLLFLLRCLLDNWNNDYYHAPFLLALLAWETARRPRLPYLSMAVVAALSVSFWPQLTKIFGDSTPYAPTLNAVYLTWTLPLAAYLALQLYAPDRASALADRLAGDGLRGARLLRAPGAWAHKTSRQPGAGRSAH